MDYKTLLKNADLRVTPVRSYVLKQLAKHKHALSSIELEECNEDLDRVTIYRTLKSFEEKGLIHKIIDANGTAKYALCEHHCNENHHHDDHIHFNCTQCGNTFCIEDSHITIPELPKGYTFNSFQFVATGVCLACNSSSK